MNKIDDLNYFYLFPIQRFVLCFVTPRVLNAAIVPIIRKLKTLLVT